MTSIVMAVGQTRTLKASYPINAIAAKPAWSIDGKKFATMVVSSDGMSVTVTATAPGNFAILSEITSLRLCSSTQFKAVAAGTNLNAMNILTS
jgi:hypothetical protein